MNLVSDDKPETEPGSSTSPPISPRHLLMNGEVLAGERSRLDCRSLSSTAASRSKFSDN